jgi:hypothetical protein
MAPPMVRDAPLSSLFDDDPIPVERPPTCPLCHGDGFDHTPPDLHWSGWCLRCDGRGVQPALWTPAGTTRNLLILKGL